MVKIAGMSVTLDKVPDVMRAISLLSTQQVLIGVPEGNASREKGTINNAAIGYINENGGVIHHPGGTRYITDAIVGDKRVTRFVGKDFAGRTKVTGPHTITIPARPHLVPGVESVTGQAINRMRDAAKSALSGNPDAVEKNLNAIGLMGQNAVRAKIRSQLPPPLAASTLAKRRARGRNGVTPLYDTGEYIKSITYVIRKREK